MQKKTIESVNDLKQPQIKYRKEKRKHLRMSVSFPVFCYSFLTKKHFFSSCENISLGGMCLTSDDFLKLDEHMEFKIEFPGRTITCQGTIVSFKSFKDSKNKKVGIKFIDLKSKTREYIANIILEMNLQSEDMTN